MLALTFRKYMIATLARCAYTILTFGCSGLTRKIDTFVIFQAANTMKTLGLIGGYVHFLLFWSDWVFWMVDALAVYWEKGVEQPTSMLFVFMVPDQLRIVPTIEAIDI